LPIACAASSVSLNWGITTSASHGGLAYGLPPVLRTRAQQALNPRSRVVCEHEGHEHLVGAVVPDHGWLHEGLGQHGKQRWSRRGFVVASSAKQEHHLGKAAASGRGFDCTDVRAVQERGTPTMDTIGLRPCETTRSRPDEVPSTNRRT
jgi:hypothetical protein